MKISTQLKKAAVNIEQDKGHFYTALPENDNTCADVFLDELFEIDSLGGSFVAQESKNVRVLAMCFAAAIAEAEGK